MDNTPEYPSSSNETVIMQSHPDLSEIYQNITDIEKRQVDYVIWHTSHSSVAYFLALVLGSAFELTDLRDSMSYFFLVLCFSSAGYALVHQFKMHKQVYLDDKTIIELNNKVYQTLKPNIQH